MSKFSFGELILSIMIHSNNETRFRERSVSPVSEMKMRLRKKSHGKGKYQIGIDRVNSYQTLCPFSHWLTERNVESQMRVSFVMFHGWIIAHKSYQVYGRKYIYLCSTYNYV